MMIKLFHIAYPGVTCPGLVAPPVQGGECLRSKPSRTMFVEQRLALPVSQLRKMLQEKNITLPRGAVEKGDLVKLILDREEDDALYS